MVYYLFATHAAFGALLSLALVPQRLTGGGFPRFINGIVLFFLVSGLLVPAGVRHPAVLWLYAAAVLPVGISAILKGDRPALRRITWIAAVLLTGCAFGLDVVTRLPENTPGLLGAVTFGSFLASASCAGSVCVAMILGHFYLVIPGLSIRPLIRLCRLLLGALIARLALAGAAILLFAPSITGLNDARALPHLWNGLSVDEGLVFWPRLLAGLLTPLVLAFMAWRTARIRSTQSATGLLYIAIIFTTIGEFLGRFLFIATGLPL